MVFVVPIHTIFNYLRYLSFLHHVQTGSRDSVGIVLSEDVIIYIVHWKKWIIPSLFFSNKN